MRYHEDYPEAYAAWLAQGRDLDAFRVHFLGLIGTPTPTLDDLAVIFDEAEQLLNAVRVASWKIIILQQQLARRGQTDDRDTPDDQAPGGPAGSNVG